jgi:outer membrane autotransporter protein
MFIRVLGALALMVLASSVWAYEVRAIYVPPPDGELVEGDGFQVVTVQVEREADDPSTQCVLEVFVSAQALSSPIPEAATPNVDFVPTTAVLTFDVGPEDGLVEETFNVPVIDDDLVEVTEFFTAVITGVNPIDCDANAVFNIDPTENFIPIFDDDSAPLTVSVARAAIAVEETVGSVDLVVTLSGAERYGAPFEVFVEWALRDGTATFGEDYGNGGDSGVLFFNQNTLTAVVTVPIIADGEPEPAEDFSFELTSAFGNLADESQIEVNIEAATTVVTIEANNQPESVGFISAQVDAAEGDGQAVLTLVRTGGTSGEVTVAYTTVDGTAVAGEDYVATSGTVIWADGDGEDKTITVELIQDEEEEEPETFSVLLTRITGNAQFGANREVTVVITDTPPTRDIAGIPTLTPNQRSLAVWFDETCARLEALASPTAGQERLTEACRLVRDAGTDDAAVREALDAINPDELLVSTFNALRLTAVQHGNLSQRLNALRGGARGVNLSGLSLEVQGQQITGNALQAMFDELLGGGASADDSVWGRWGVFINGRLATGEKDRTDNEAGFDFDLYGVTAGVDYRIRDNLIFGVSAGFGAVDTKFENRSGGLDIDSWNVGAYLTYFRDEQFYFDALATFGRNDYDSARLIQFGSGPQAFEGTARGSTNGTQYSLGFGTGWDFNRGAFTYGPHMGAYFFDVDVDGFQETGVLGLELDIGDQSNRSFTVNAGGHVSYAMLTSWGVLVPNARLDWVREFEDGSEVLSYRFVNDPFANDPNDPSPVVTLQSDRPDSNYFIWSVGLSAQFIQGFAGFVNYQSYAGYSNVKLREWSFGARWEKTF